MSVDMILPNFLPGTLSMHHGTGADYRALSMFHYAAGPPATVAAVWVIRYSDSGTDRTVAAGVLSWPVPSCRAREQWLGLSGSRAKKLRFINTHLRTISRIVVHPQFRSLGLGVALARRLCEHCPTRFVEAIARMGHVHPIFHRAGMTLVNPGQLDEPAYFILDRLCARTQPAAA